MEEGHKQEGKPDMDYLLCVRSLFFHAMKSTLCNHRFIYKPSFGGGGRPNLQKQHGQLQNTTVFRQHKQTDLSQQKERMTVLIPITQTNLNISSFGLFSFSNCEDKLQKLTRLKIQSRSLDLIQQSWKLEKNEKKKETSCPLSDMRQQLICINQNEGVTAD